MKEKKEVQVTILKEKPGKATPEEFIAILRHVAPGTQLRAALDGIVKANKGALIVVESPALPTILDGGFKINSRFTPQRLIELAKMDGAILLSEEMKRITFANTTLAPDTKIASKETGTRHKAAERTAKMMHTLAIAISEKKQEINLYYKDIKYHLRSTTEVARRAAETLHLLEKQRELFDNHLSLLNLMERSNEFHIEQACKVIQKGKAMQKILKGQEKTLIELGREGEALKLRIKELMRGVEKETDLIIKDYTKLNLKKSKNLLASLSYDELINSENIATALAQQETGKLSAIKGWRFLTKTSLQDKDQATLIKELKTLPEVLNADEPVLADILDKTQAKTLHKELTVLKNQ